MLRQSMVDKFLYLHRIQTSDWAVVEESLLFPILKAGKLWSLFENLFCNKLLVYSLVHLLLQDFVSKQSLTNKVFQASIHQEKELC